jgi:hypothetical protein
MTRKHFPSFIIVSGSGKKVGKTFLATAMIRHYASVFPLVALKISPHVHDSLGDTKLIAASGGFRIFEDLGSHKKNSGQHLAAGASRSFFMETGDEDLPDSFGLFLDVCNPQKLPVICESGALGNLIKPGILFFIADPAHELQHHKRTSMEYADLVLPARSFSAPEVVSRTGFSGSNWNYSG